MSNLTSLTNEYQDRPIIMFSKSLNQGIRRGRNFARKCKSFRPRGSVHIRLHLLELRKEEQNET